MSETRKKIVEFIRAGWRLSSYHCPVCDNPIVTKDNKFFCAVCNKEVKIVKDEAELRKVVMEGVLERLRGKLIEYINQIIEIEDWAFDEKNLRLINQYLDIILKVKEIFKS